MKIRLAQLWQASVVSGLGQALAAQPGKLRCRNELSGCRLGTKVGHCREPMRNPMIADDLIRCQSAVALLRAKAYALRVQGVVPLRQRRPFEELQDVDLYRTQHARVAARQRCQPAAQQLSLRWPYSLVRTLLPMAPAHAATPK